MLQVDWDALPFDQNGQQYLSILFAEVDEPYKLPLDAQSGVFYSYEISTDVELFSCPDYDGSLAGGGGKRDSVSETTNEIIFNSWKLALCPNKNPDVTDYTIDFDAIGNFPLQSVIPGDYISIQFA